MFGNFRYPATTLIPIPSHIHMSSYNVTRYVLHSVNRRNINFLLITFFMQILWTPLNDVHNLNPTQKTLSLPPVRIPLVGTSCYPDACTVKKKFIILTRIIFIICIFIWVPRRKIHTCIWENSTAPAHIPILVYLHNKHFFRQRELISHCEINKSKYFTRLLC